LLKAKAGHSVPTFGQRKPQSFTGDYIDLIDLMGQNRNQWDGQLERIQTLMTRWAESCI
jgi:hypothetical protein